MGSAKAPAVRHPSVRLLVLGLLVVVLPLITVTVGPAAVPLDQLLPLLGNHAGLSFPVTWDGITEAIVWENRVPRIITGVGVGAVLGASGAALQALVRNPLAEPYVLGVSSGASTGAAVAIVALGLSSAQSVAGLAFIGALTATAVVVFAGGNSANSALRLVLAGLAIGFCCQSLTNLIIFAADSPETSRAVLFWTLGSLGRASWPEAVAILAAGAVTGVILAATGPVLDALATGDRTALSVGIRPGLARILLLIPISAAVAIAVSVAGGIGFIGLVVPHLMRPAVSYRHRPLIVASALGGGIFLSMADAIARVAFSPAEIPIGVVTGAVGAPFLLALALRQRATP